MMVVMFRHEPMATMKHGGLGKWFEYHAEGKDQSGYAEYLMDGHGDGQWIQGGMWSRLGHDLSLGLTKEQYVDLAEGNWQGEVLVPPMRGVHRPGIDMQLSPQKSVSVGLLGLGPAGRDLVYRAHKDAVAAAMGYLEANAAGARVTRDKVMEDETAELAYFCSTHSTSRPTEESIERAMPPDPQLHTHVMLFNVCWSAGKFRAFDHQAVVHVAKEVEAVYTLTLRQRLTDGELAVADGVDRRGRRTVDLPGIDKRVIRMFSSAGRKVTKSKRQFEQTYGRGPTPKEDSDLAKAVRLPKDCDHGKIPEWREYVDGLVRLGLPVPNVVRGQERYRTFQTRWAEAWERAVEAVTEDGASVHRYEVKALVLNACIGLLRVDEALQLGTRLIESPELVVTEAANKDPDYDQVTTKTHLRRELETSTLAELKHHEDHRQVPRWAIGLAISAADVPLSEEQIAAVHEGCSGSGFKIFQGEAGTGKTTVFRTIIEAHRIAGLVDKVVVVSTAANTAIRNGVKLGADYYGSVEQIASKCKKGVWLKDKRTNRARRVPFRITDVTLVIADETVMMDTPRFSKLMKLSKRGIVRILGDPHQLQAIGAGGMHMDLAERLGFSPLTEVFRQKHQWYVDACRAIRAREGAKALELIAEHDGLHVADTQAEAIGELVKLWASLRRQGASLDDLVVNTDQPNEVIDQLNRLLQDVRMGLGEIGGESITVVDTQDDRVESFHVGDVVAFTTGYGSVPNGTSGVIENVDTVQGRVVVATNKGPVMVGLTSVGEQLIRLNYAGHATRHQGNEGKHLLVLPGSWQTDCVSGYSMVTRGEEDVHVFLSNEMHAKGGKTPTQFLGDRWSEFRPKRTADYEMSAPDGVDPVELVLDDSADGHEVRPGHVVRSIADDGPNLVR